MFVKLCLLLMSFAACFAANAQEHASTVKSVECNLIAKSDSTFGTIAGTAGGAVGGALIGGALFGKNGNVLGGLAGSLAGGYAGNEMASSKTYNCLVMVSNRAGKDIYIETLVQKPIQVGQTVRVFEGQDGKAFIR